MALEAHNTPARGLSKAHCLQLVGLAGVIAALLIVGTIGGQPRTSADNPSGVVQRQLISGKETLRGLTGVYVMVEPLGTEVEKRGLTKDQIQTDVELSLRRNGIRVLSIQECFATPGQPYLYVNVNVLTRDDLPMAAYSISVELAQLVILGRDQAKETQATTWCTGYVGAVDVSQLQSICDGVKKYVDRFSNDFLAVNPK